MAKSKKKAPTPTAAVKKLRRSMKGRFWRGEYGDKALDSLFSYATSAILNDEAFEIEKVYARSNKAVHFSRAEGEVGVKLKGGGYAILRQGKIYTHGDYRNALRGLDAAIGGYVGGRFGNLWDSLSESEKAKLSSKLRKIDWAKVWSEDYDPKTGLFTNDQVEQEVTEYIQEIRPDFR